jgi:hypothetical protein
MILWLVHFQIAFAQAQVEIVSPEPYSVYCSDSPLLIKFNENVENVGIRLAEYQFGETKYLSKNFSGNEFKWVIDDPYWFDKNFTIIIEKAELSEQIARVDNIRIAVIPKMLRQTESAIVCKGETIILEVDADGSELRYQWYRDNKKIDDADKTVFMIENANYSASGIYHCNISSNYGCPDITSKPIGVFVNTPTRFTVEPLHIQWEYLKTAEFKVRIHANEKIETHDINFKWYRDTLDIYTLEYVQIELADNERISGTQSDFLTIKNLNYFDRGTYYCIADGQCGKDTIYAEIGEFEFYFTIIKVRHDDAVCEGDSAVLEIEVESSLADGFQYQWYQTGLRVVKESENFVGTKTSKLTIRNISRDHFGSYYCRVSLPSYGIWQNSEFFFIDPEFLPELFVQPKDYIIRNRDNISIGSVAIWAGAVNHKECRFDWYRNDTLVLTTYSKLGSNYWLEDENGLRKALKSDVGTYYCKVSNSCGEIYSDTVQVVWGYEDVILCEFSKASLEVDKSPIGKEEDFNYIWYKNNKLFVPNFRIKGNGTNKLDFAWVIYSDNADYHVWRQHKETSISEYLGKIHLEVKIPPDIQKQFDDTLRNIGDFIPTSNCNVYAHGPFLSFQLFCNGEIVKSGTRLIVDKLQSFTIGGYDKTLKTGTYQYRFWNECGESWTDPFEIINTNYKPSGEVKPGGDEDYAASVPDFTIPQMFIYPNPARDYLTVHCAHFIPRTISIRNLVGGEVYKMEIESGASSVPINFADKKLPSGMYFIHVTDGVNFLVEKIILQ